MALIVVALQADAAVVADVPTLPAGEGFIPGHYPIYSAHFVGQPSPFHETVQMLIAKGAVRQPPQVAQNLWRQGIKDSPVGSYRMPIYVSTADQPLYAFTCVTYGRCKANGVKVHIPRFATPSDDSDHHLSVLDPISGGELDGWGGDGDPAHACTLRAHALNCSWGGFFPFSSNGLDQNTGDSANNGGYAFGLFLISAQEILQGHIDHALGMSASCLDNPNIYPADTIKVTDFSCSGRTHVHNPQYGQLVALRNSFDIAGSAYSPACKTVLTAFARYGAYTRDTNQHWGLDLDTDDPSMYAAPNPWYTKIYPEMVEHGDGDGTGSAFHYKSCLNRVAASDIEVYDIAPGS